MSADRDTVPAADPNGGDDAIVFALGPAGGSARRAPARSALGWALTGALGRPVEVRAFDSYSKLPEVLSRVHFAWLPPAIYVRLRGSLHLAVALPRTASGAFHGVLFTRGDRDDVRTVKDLRGRRIAWVHTESAAGHLFPRLLLRQHGIRTTDLAQQLWLDSHGAVVEAVASGAADAGATYGHLDEDGLILHAGWSEWPGSEMRPIGISPPIPPDVICTTDAGARLASRFRTALRSLASHESGQGLLGGLFGTSRIVDVDEASYDVVLDALASILDL